MADFLQEETEIHYDFGDVIKNINSKLDEINTILDQIIAEL